MQRPTELLHIQVTLNFYYYTRFSRPFSGTTQVSWYQKGKTNLDFTEGRDSESSGISWAVCKSAPCSGQVTMPTPHHPVFLQAECPSCHSTNSIIALKWTYNVSRHLKRLTTAKPSQSKLNVINFQKTTLPQQTRFTYSLNFKISLYNGS